MAPGLAGDRMSKRMKGPSSPASMSSAPSSKPTWLPQPFDYIPLGRVIFEAGAIARLGGLARELGGSRVLLVTDPGLEHAGHPQRAIASLREAGLDVAVFDGVQENPMARHVEAGVAAAKAQRAV